MAERLIQIVVPAAKAGRMRVLIRGAGVVELRRDTSDAVHLFTLQVPAEQVEAVLDPIQTAFNSTDGFHAFVLPIEAALPTAVGVGAGTRQQHTGNGPSPFGTFTHQSRRALRRPERPRPHHARFPRYGRFIDDRRGRRPFSRQRGYRHRCDVMAPLLGPNMALSLDTPLGDTKLASQALRTTVIGILLAAVVALACGFLLSIDPKSTEIASRTFVGPTDLVVALAAGIAGALAFSSGVAASLVGVMAAVALLPPLVVCSMLLAAGYTGESLGRCCCYAT